MATLELTDTTLGTGGSGTVTTTFNGGRIASVQGEASLTLPVTFAGAADAPTTLDPGKYGTLVLNAANQGNGAIAVPRGTVALANANGLGNATATIADGAAFESRGFTGEYEGAEEARAIPVVAIKIDIPAGVGETGSGGGYDGTAIQEFCLYEGGTWIRWPEGTTISGTGDRGTATWTPQGNGQINALIDRVVGTATAPGTGINPNGENVTYDEATSNNKWFMTDGATAANTATILLGDGGAVFDSYSFFNSDRATRFPSGWTISVRYEGDAADSWTVLDTQANQERPAANVESQHYAVTLRTTGGATTLDDVTSPASPAASRSARTSASSSTARNTPSRPTTSTRPRAWSPSVRMRRSPPMP